MHLEGKCILLYGYEETEQNQRVNHLKLMLIVDAVRLYSNY